MRKTKWQPPSQGQYKYLFGKLRNEWHICFEGGFQRVESRVDPPLSFLRKWVGQESSLSELGSFVH